MRFTAQKQGSLVRGFLTIETVAADGAARRSAQVSTAVTVNRLAARKVHDTVVHLATTGYDTAVTRAAFAVAGKTLRAN